MLIVLAYMPIDILIRGYLHTLASSTWLPTIFLLVADYGELRHLRLGRVDLLVGFGMKAGLFTPCIILFWFHNRS
jgi:hypothetical protein